MEDVYVMLLGDFSPCLEHLVRAYYMAKTKQNSETFLEESEKVGIVTNIGKKTVRVHLQIATTKHKLSQAKTDGCRADEYKSRLLDTDLIVLCFYQNNRKTLTNIYHKYKTELQEWYPKTPSYLMGVLINEIKDGMVKPLRETISLEDRWLNRDLDVLDKDGKNIARIIKAQSYLKCKTITRDESFESESDLGEEEVENCKEVERAIDKCVKFIIRRKNRKCIRPF